MSFFRLGLDYNKWIEREAAQADMDKRLQEHERMAEPQDVLPFNWQMPFELRLNREQWAVFLDAARAAGELTVEELITEALQEWMTRRTERREVVFEDGSRTGMKP